MAIILGIESSCDDTSAAVINDGLILSNLIANQSVHEEFGGVVPELASRAHQQNIIPVVDNAIKKAGISVKDIDAIAFTRGPGLLGSLLVGTSFAKGLSIANNIPLIEVNHLQAHVLAHFIKENEEDTNQPEFPFLCLLVSGGHTEIVVVKSPTNMDVIGKTIDDAAGEAFDKCAKVMKLPYPGGPVIDKLAKLGDANKFQFNKPRIKNLDYSFSGLKTSFLYFLRDRMKENDKFIDENINDLSASIQRTIIEILLDKFTKAIKQTGIKHIAVAGGVSANSEIKYQLELLAKQLKLKLFVPSFGFTTDNAAMIAISGYYKYLEKDFSNLDIVPQARYSI